MYIFAVFSQPETQHFLGANDGGCAPGAGEKDPTVAQMLMMHQRLITTGNGSTLPCGCPARPGEGAHPAPSRALPSPRSPHPPGVAAAGAANRQFELGFKYLQITTCR